MNKRLVYLFAVLVLTLFVISACEQAVGRKISNVAVNDDINNQVANAGDRGEVEPQYDTMFQSNNNRLDVAIHTQLYPNRDNFVESLFYYDRNSESIKIGSDYDEQLIIREGDSINADDIGGNYLNDLQGIKFLYYKNGRTDLITIKNIDVLSNKTTFKVKSTNREYEDLEYTSGRPTTFGFLENDFTLTLDNDNARITFDDINNDQEDGVSKIVTWADEIITLSETNPMIVIEDRQWRAGNDGEGKININLKYDGDNQEIDIDGIIIEDVSTRFKNLGINFNRARRNGNDEIKLKYS